MRKTQSIPKHQKSVALITYYYYPYISGLSEVVKGIAETLVERKYTVDVYVTRHEKELPTYEISNGVHIYRSNILLTINRYSFSPLLLFSILRNRRKYDKIIIPLPFIEAGLIALFIHPHKMIPYYICDAGMEKTTKISSFFQSLAFLSMKFMLRKSEQIWAMTKDHFQFSPVFSKDYTHKLKEIPPPVTMEKKDVSTTAIANFRKRYNIPKRQYYIGFLGRITFEKGLFYLLSAIPRIKHKIGDDFCIIIAGDYKNVRGSSSYDQLLSLIKKHKDHVTVTGFLSEDEKHQFYSTIDVFCLPSIDPLEAFGIVQVEAMMYGKPVVSSDLPGVRTILRQTGFGKSSKIRDSDSIADAIASVLLDTSFHTSTSDNWEKYYGKDVWEKRLITLIGKN